MSNYSSVINHPAGNRFVAIPEDYVGICRNAGVNIPQCGAALLNWLELWSGYRARVIEEQAMRPVTYDPNTGQRISPVTLDRWIFMPVARIHEELQGTWGTTTIRKTLIELENIGYIQTRNNPDKGYDRTKQYLLNVDLVNADIAAWVMGDAPDRVKATVSHYISPAKLDESNCHTDEIDVSQVSSHLTPASNQFDADTQTIQYINNTEAVEEKRKKKKEMSAPKSAATDARPIDPVFEAISSAWNLDPKRSAGYIGKMKSQLVNAPNARGQHKAHAIDPAMSADEIAGFRVWWTAHPDMKDINFPEKPETIERMVAKFRGDDRYDRALEVGAQRLADFIAQRHPNRTISATPAIEDMPEPPAGDNPDTNKPADAATMAELERRFAQFGLKPKGQTNDE